jgi:hypothetical protein
LKLSATRGTRFNDFYFCFHLELRDLKQGVVPGYALQNEKGEYFIFVSYGIKIL